MFQGMGEHHMGWGFPSIKISSMRI